MKALTQNNRHSSLRSTYIFSFGTSCTPCINPVNAGAKENRKSQLLQTDCCTTLLLFFAHLGQFRAVTSLHSNLVLATFKIYCEEPNKINVSEK